MRTKITDEEFNAISHYTEALNLDFDIVDCGETDQFYDFDEEKYISLEQGISYLYDAQSYDYEHDGMSEEEGKILDRLFEEFI